MKYQLLFVMLLLFLVSCDKTETNKVDFDRNALLTNYADNIIIPRYENLKENSNQLHRVALNFQADANQTNLDELRLAFKATYVAWQVCSSLEFGPASMETLKTVFNTYPLDTVQLLSNINTGSYNLETAQNIDAIGLPALDFLLYGIENNDQAIINRLSSQTSSLTYILALTEQLKTKSNKVYTDWNSTYRNTFVSANGTDVGSALGLLINEMNLDFEKFIRDGKIGIPLGKRSLGVAQVDKSEAYYSQYSLTLAKESIKGLKALFEGTSTQGSNGLGIDDYLDAVNATNNGQALSIVITNQLEAIQSSLNAINGSLEDAIQNNPSQVEDVYNNMQQLIVYLKVDLPSNLGILISYQDNDGD